MFYGTYEALISPLIFCIGSDIVDYIISELMTFSALSARPKDSIICHMFERYDEGFSP